MAGFAGFVQSPTVAAGAVLGGAVSTFSPAAWANNVVAGNRIVVVTSVWKTGGQQTCTGVTDSAGNTYTKDAQINHSVSQQSLAVFSAPILAGGGTKPTITATASANGCSVSIGVVEYTSLDASVGSAAVNTSGTTTSTIGATPTATTAGNCTVLDELAFVVGGGNGDSKTWSANTVAGSTGLARGNNTPDANADIFIEDNPSGATGATKAGTFTIGGGGVNSTAIIVLYKLRVTTAAVVGRPLTWRQLKPSGNLRGQAAMRLQITRFEAKPYWTPASASGPVDTTVTPDTASLVLTGFAPDVLTPVVVTPPTATLTLTSFAPIIATTIVVPTASLTLTTFAPTVPVTVTPSTASLVLTSFAPTVSISNNQSVVPSTASLVLASFAPTVSVSDNKSVVPSTASLVLATFAPVVTATANQVATPGTAALVLTTFAPTVTVSSGTTAIPDMAALTLTTLSPVVSTTANQIVIPDTLALVLTTYAPNEELPPPPIGDGGSGVVSYSQTRQHVQVERPRPAPVSRPRGLVQEAVDNRAAIVALYVAGYLTDEELAALLAA